jgi:serine/threonine protein kinase
MSFVLEIRELSILKAPDASNYIVVRKEHYKYDRRKKVGTARASDIWSLRCLLYELLTGEFLSIMKTGLSSLIDVFLLMKNC